MGIDEEEKSPEKRPGEEEEFDGKTYLYIKTNPLDDGNESLRSGLECWVSPHITIIKPDNTRGGEAIAGQSNSVEVIVTNKGGIDAVNSYLEVYVADPTTVVTPSSSKKIFSGYITVPHDNTVTVTTQWVPSFDEGGHKCILARVCSTIPPDCFKDWNIFDVVGDRHEAQRNIFIVSIPEGENSLSFGFQVVNPKMKEKEFIIRAVPVDISAKPYIIRSIFGNTSVKLNQKIRGNLHLTIGDIIESKTVINPHTVEKLKLEGLSKNKQVLEKFSFGIMKEALPIIGARKSARRLSMVEQEVRRSAITIQRIRGAQPGDLQVVQIEQMDVQAEQVIGGICLIIQH
jgi:hypothetical protein